MFAIETRQIPDQQVATIERRVLVGGLPRFISEAMGLVHDALGQAGAESGIPFVVYHGEVNTDSDGPVEVCVPYVGDVKPTGEIRLRLEPGHKEAYTRLTKSQVAFPGILEAYEAVMKWAADNGQRARRVAPGGLLHRLGRGRRRRFGLRHRSAGHGLGVPPGSAPKGVVRSPFTDGFATFWRRRSRRRWRPQMEG